MKSASNLDPRHLVFSLQYGDYQMDERSGFNVNQGFQCQVFVKTILIAKGEYMAKMVLTLN